MPTRRPKKTNHLIYADMVDSRSKSGIWFSHAEEFKGQQQSVIRALKEKLDWVPIENAIMAISIEPPGIVLIAPNPSLPGIIVLADGATPASTDELKARYTGLVREATAQIGVKIEV
jgi:hypothetical protein